MIERLAEQIFNDIRDTASKLSDSSGGSSRIKAIIEAKLRRLNLVTREEFDAQSAVLARTRNELESMHTKMEALNAQFDRISAGQKTQGK